MSLAYTLTLFEVGILDGWILGSRNVTYHPLVIVTLTADLFSSIDSSAHPILLRLEFQIKFVDGSLFCLFDLILNVPSTIFQL